MRFPITNIEPPPAPEKPELGVFLPGTFGEFDGVRMPVRGEAIWKLKAGDLPYIRFDIVEVEYNVAETY